MIPELDSYTVSWVTNLNKCELGDLPEEFEKLPEKLNELRPKGETSME